MIWYITPMEDTLSQEMMPIDNQLQVTTDFIVTQLNDVEPREEEGWSDDVIVARREAPRLRLANGAIICCSSKTTLVGNETARYSIGVIHRGQQHTLYINSDGTFDFSASKGSVDLYDYEELPYAEAVQNLDFISLIDFLSRTITEEVPKPKRPFIPRSLPTSLLLIEQQHERPDMDTRLEVGYDELPLKGQDATLIDNNNKLYGVFDGVGGADGSENGARLAAVTIQEYMGQVDTNEPAEQLSALVNALHEADLTIGTWHEAGTDAGATTATLAKIVTRDSQNYVIWASVGDSRLYIKTADGQLKQISKAEGEGHRLHNALGRGFKGVEQLGILELAEGTELVLVTDGITGDYDDDILQDHEILQILDSSPSAKAAAKELVFISRKHDDKSAVVIRYL
jgi:serine/threonine protein phosphatase PrpC